MLRCGGNMAQSFYGIAIYGVSRYGGFSPFGNTIIVDSTITGTVADPLIVESPISTDPISIDSTIPL